jgi:ribosome-binding protein aMBF1 (putative translation factor)
MKPRSLFYEYYMLATITNKGREFQPDWVSPPGDTIAEHLGERSWTQAELATRTGYTEKHVSQLIAGEVSLTDDAAERLARVLGPWKRSIRRAGGGNRRARSARTNAPG